MNTETQIINYLQQLSKGLVNINRAQARHIISLVTASSADTGALAKLLRYNATSSTWELIRVISTTDEAIAHRWQEALEKGPVHYFYQYILYNSSGESEGVIYSANSNLF